MASYLWNENRSYISQLFWAPSLKLSLQSWQLLHGKEDQKGSAVGCETSRAAQEMQEGARAGGRSLALQGAATIVL